MKLKLSVSLLAATTIFSSFSSVLPAYSQSQSTSFSEMTRFYLDQKGPGCNEEALGHTTINNHASSTHDNQYSDQKGGGGKVNFGVGIFRGGLGGNGARTTQERNSGSDAYNRDQEILVPGLDCTVDNLSRVEIITNQQNNETQRYGIEAQVEMNRDNNQTQRIILEEQLRFNQFNNLLNW